MDQACAPEEGVRISLQGWMALLVAAVAGLTMFLLGALVIRASRDVLSRHLQREGETVALCLAAGAAPAMEAGRFERLGAPAAAVLQDDHILAVRILDRKGRVVSVQGPARESLSDVQWIAAPIASPKGRLGTVELGLNLALQRRETERFTRWLALALGVSNIAIFGLIYGSMRALILAPLEKILAALSAIRSGRTAHRVPFLGEGEFGILGAVLNRMMDDLQEMHARAQRAQETEIQSLRAIIPICAHCKKIRNDKGFWDSVEKYFSQRPGVRFSHGICPDCVRKHFPQYADEPEDTAGPEGPGPGPRT